VSELWLLSVVVTQAPIVVNLNTAAAEAFRAGADAGQAPDYVVGFSPDSKLFAVAQDGAHGGGSSKIVLYDTKTWAEVESFPGDVFAFAPDGRTLAVSSLEKTGVQLYSLADRKQVGSLATAAEIGGAPRGMVYSPDGRDLAVADGLSGVDPTAIFTSRTGIPPPPGEPHDSGSTPPDQQGAARRTRCPRDQP
jgi:WD40 repeat protein